MIYWLQEATEAGAQGAASAWSSAILSGGVVGAIVGLVGVLIGQYLTTRRHSQTLEQAAKLETQRANKAAELEAQRAHEAALQKYFEQVGKLLIEQPLRRATPGDNLSTVARAQTLAVLEGLDPGRKRILLEFLYESNLIKVDKPVIDLQGANLSEANLIGANLIGAYLSRANLSGANLSEAYLREAHLTSAYLPGANLSGIILAGTDLSGITLRGVDLSLVVLSEANLSENISLTQAQIEEAFGDEHTTLPDHLQRPVHWK